MASMPPAAWTGPSGVSSSGGACAGGHPRPLAAENLFTARTSNSSSGTLPTSRARSRHASMSSRDPNTIDSTAESGSGAGTKTSGASPASSGQRRSSTPPGVGTITGPAHAVSETTTWHGLRCPASAVA